MPCLHFIRQGQGPLVVLSHALGCDLTMWDGVARALEEHYSVLRYDHRGHGRSGGVGETFTLDDLTDDAAQLIRLQAVGKPVHFVGLSMGGMTAQALGARYPNLVRSLVIANSTSVYDQPARQMWQTRVDIVRAHGMAAIAESAIQRWFTPEFREDVVNGAARVATLRAVLEATAPAPYAAACDAVAQVDLVSNNKCITCPTLIIAGSRDEATPPALSRRIADTIRGAELLELDTAHLSAVEQPEAFAGLLVEFWRRQEA